MDLTILQTVAQRISYAQASNLKEVRFSIAEAQQLLAAIAYATAKDNQQLRDKLDDLLTKVQQISSTPSLPPTLSGGKF
jgi:1,2-phenylacetyl-CoA epoxidase catalytic subunit